MANAIKRNRREVVLHPGDVLRGILADEKLSQLDLARHLGVAPAKINEICNGKRGISPLMASKLACAFEQRPEYWLDMQRDWELSRLDRGGTSSIGVLRKVNE